MTSHKLTTNLKYTYDGLGTFWQIYKNDFLFADLITNEKT
jgi:hypothetical protein